MAVAASLLKSEMRRHLLMNIGLVSSCVVAGTVVTNERGLFVPLGIHGMSETARAFAAMFTPSHLLPGFTNVQMVAPLEPFDVTADSRDLRRRLMDAFSDFSAPAAGLDPSQDIAQYSGDQTLTPMELAQNDPTGGVAPTGSNASAASASSTPSAASAASTAAATGDTSQGGQSATSTGNTATTGTSSPLQRSTGDLLTSSQTQANSETNAGTVDTGGGTNVITPPIVTPPDNTTPVPEPSVWAMMVAGFGAVGYMIRSSARRRREEKEDAELFGDGLFMDEAELFG